MNIHDIAKEASVSAATVSRVLNNSYLVKQITREKVQRVIDKYLFVPNALARGLIHGTSKTVGVLTNDIRSPYSATIVHILEKEFNNLGINVILSNIENNLETKKEYIKVLLEKQVDSLIFVGSAFNKTADNKHIINASMSVPVVLINSYLRGNNIYSIFCNDFDGVYSATSYLIGKGHSNIIYLHGSETISANNKLKGYKKALIDNKLPVRRKFILKASAGVNQEAYDDMDVVNFEDYKRIEIWNSLGRLLQEKDDFSAIVAYNEFAAIHAIKLLKRNGINVPGDVAVIGCDNTYLAKIMDPELTTIDTGIVIMGKKCVEILDNILNKKKVEKRIIVKPKLIIRSST